MTALDRDPPFTMLIEFDVPPERQAEYVDRLAAQIALSLPGTDGFLSATVQGSLDGRTVINYAQWASREAWESATGLDASRTGRSHRASWAENVTSGTLFGPETELNPVAAMLEAVGGHTLSVTAFTHTRYVNATMAT